MGDHFVLLVDRLITDSTLEAMIESRNLGQVRCLSGDSEALGQCSGNPIIEEMGINRKGSSLKVVECRICQDEDQACNMETPCACCGSLKYAHRKCVQRWCNEKGNTMCEICHQQFQPGYTAPPKMFHYGGLPNFRGSWEISRQPLDLQNPQFIAMVSTDRNFLNTGFDDYSASNSRSVTCCRSVAVIFLVLLILRHTLPFLIGGAEEYAFTLFTLFLLRVAGILLPFYIMARAVAAIHRRHRQQEASEVELDASEDELEQPPHVINVP
ncbi:hypothetical protein AMTRI_Chr13g118980 [Amborella trichopoda]